jgi:hypothetical protein
MIFKKFAILFTLSIFIKAAWALPGSSLYDYSNLDVNNKLSIINIGTIDKCFSEDTSEYGLNLLGADKFLCNQQSDPDKFCNCVEVMAGDSLLSNKDAYIESINKGLKTYILQRYIDDKKGEIFNNINPIHELLRSYDNKNNSCLSSNILSNYQRILRNDRNSGVVDKFGSTQISEVLKEVQNSEDRAKNSNIISDRKEDSLFIADVMENVFGKDKSFAQINEMANELKAGDDILSNRLSSYLKTLKPSSYENSSLAKFVTGSYSGNNFISNLISSIGTDVNRQIGMSENSAGAVTNESHYKILALSANGIENSIIQNKDLLDDIKERTNKGIAVLGNNYCSDVSAFLNNGLTLSQIRHNASETIDSLFDFSNGKDGQKELLELQKITQGNIAMLAREYLRSNPEDYEGAKNLSLNKSFEVDFLYCSRFREKEKLDEALGYFSPRVIAKLVDIRSDYTALEKEILVRDGNVALIDTRIAEIKRNRFNLQTKVDALQSRFERFESIEKSVVKDGDSYIINFDNNISLRELNTLIPESMRESLEFTSEKDKSGKISISIDQFEKLKKQAKSQFVIAKSDLANNKRMHEVWKKRKDEEYLNKNTLLKQQSLLLKKAKDILPDISENEVVRYLNTGVHHIVNKEEDGKIIIAEVKDTPVVISDDDKDTIENLDFIREVFGDSFIPNKKSKKEEKEYLPEEAIVNNANIPLDNTKTISEDNNQLTNVKEPVNKTKALNPDTKEELVFKNETLPEESFVTSKETRGDRINFRNNVETRQSSIRSESDNPLGALRNNVGKRVNKIQKTRTGRSEIDLTNDIEKLRIEIEREKIATQRVELERVQKSNLVNPSQVKADVTAIANQLSSVKAGGVSQTPIANNLKAVNNIPSSAGLQNNSPSREVRRLSSNDSTISKSLVLSEAITGTGEKTIKFSSLSDSEVNDSDLKIIQSEVDVRALGAKELNEFLKDYGLVESEEFLVKLPDGSVVKVELSNLEKNSSQDELNNFVGPLRPDEQISTDRKRIQGLNEELNLGLELDK